MNAFRRVAAVGTLAAVGVLSSTASAGVSYWDFNVFSRSTLGSAGQGYGASIQGASGALGDAYFTNFSAKGTSGSSPSLTHGFYGGGMLRISSGSISNGGVHVAGSIDLNGASIYGPVFGGGNIGGSGGTIYGNATITGIKPSGSVSVTGVLTTGQSYTPLVDLYDVAGYFQGFGTSAAAIAPTTSYANNWGELVINAVGPLTVVNVGMSDFVNAWGVRVVGGGAVVVNVDGTTVNFGSKTWTYQNGASSTSTLLNLNQATSVTISGGQNVNILAANAATQFSSGVVTGNLIVGSLMGAGQVDWNSSGGFSGAEYVPTPGGFAIFAVAALIATRRRREVAFGVRSRAG